MSNYPWQEIDPKDFIYIESEKELTMQDVRVLTKLYKPIIGGTAYSFYQSLFSELDFKANQKMTTVSRLLTKIDTGIVDFYQDKIRLEGLGLLRSYRSKTKENKYFYELENPLTTEAFLEDNLLQSLLIEKIGKKAFQEEIKDLVIEPQAKDDYEELTRSFTEVYHFNVENKDLAVNNYSFNSENRVKISKDIENIDSFDYSFFKKGLNQHFVKKDSLTKDIKELIYTYHIIYGIDELTMQSIVLESTDVESGRIIKSKLTNTVQRMYLNKQKNKIVSNPSSFDKSTENSKKRKEKLSKKGFTSSEISVINHAKKAAPAHYLRSIKDQLNGFVTSNETWVLKELVEQSPLSKEVINILLHYILVIQKAVILDKNYATKIANDWAQHDIKTAEDAVIKLRDIFKQSKKRASQNKRSYSKKKYSKNYGRKTKKEKLPDWAKNNSKNESAEENQSLSSKDENALKVRLERIRQQAKSKEDS